MKGLDPNSGWIVAVRCFLELVANCLSRSHAIRIQLLLSGDIELNPGPLTEELNHMFNVIMTIPAVQEKQSDILEEIRSIRLEQQALENKLSALTEKVKDVENVSSVLSVKDDVARLVSQTDSLTSACARLQSSHDDQENRLRRNNLIFCCLKDDVKETWAEAEASIIAFCSERLSILLDSAAIERAHRLGHFTRTKERPLIVKFLSFKDKRVLTAAAKLKGTKFAISEDFSAKIRLERQKLLHFAREQGGDYKLRFNKLKMGKETFVYNSETESVTPCTR